MTGKEFKNIRLSVLKVNRAELAILMDTPLPTIRDIEKVYADQEIKGCYKRLLELLVERDTWVMMNIYAEVEKRIDRLYPSGIRSEVANDK